MKNAKIFLREVQYLHNRHKSVLVSDQAYITLDYLAVDLMRRRKELLQECRNDKDYQRASALLDIVCEVRGSKVYWERV